MPAVVIVCIPLFLIIAWLLLDILCTMSRTDKIMRENERERQTYL